MLHAPSHLPPIYAFSVVLSGLIAVSFELPIAWSECDVCIVALRSAFQVISFGYRSFLMASAQRRWKCLLIQDCLEKGKRWLAFFDIKPLFVLQSFLNSAWYEFLLKWTKPCSSRKGMLYIPLLNAVWMSSIRINPSGLTRFLFRISAASFLCSTAQLSFPPLSAWSM